MTTERGPADPLFTPSLGDAQRLDRPPGQRPWRLSSQFLLSFYGGALPLTWIAYRNAERLGLPRQTQIRIAATGGAMTVLLVGTAVAVIANRDLFTAWFGDWNRARTASRLLFRAGGVVLYLIFAAWQKPGDRRYAMLGTGEYDSLWRPGLMAAVVSDVAVVGLVLLLTLLLVK